MSIEQISEIRNWLLFLIGTTGAYITISTFISNTKQRRLDNTFKMLDYLRKHITQPQINTFIELFHANNPLGVGGNEFHFKDGRKDIIETMFSEGGCGNGDIHNMIEVFNLISKHLKRKYLNEELIWYEYGQIMEKCYEWTKYLDENTHTMVDLSKKDGMTDEDYKIYKRVWKEQFDGMTFFFRQFNAYMKNATIEYKRLPTKHYVYLE